MIIERIHHHARETPQRFAVVHNGLPTNYLRFARLVARTRRWCAALAIPRGDGPVAILSINLFTGWLLVLALRSLGHTTLYAGNWAAIEGLGLPSLAAIIVNDIAQDDLAAIRRSAPDLAIHGLPPRLYADAGTQDIAALAGIATFGDHIEYTSGTTGVNKGLLRDGRLTPLLVERATMEFHLGADSSFGLLGTPPWTGVGDKAALACWSLGACVVIDQRTDWPEHIGSAPIDRLFMNPETVKRLAQPGIATRPAPGLRLYCGGGFLAPRIARLAKSVLNCELFMAYAATEVGTRVRTPVIDDDEDVVWLQPLPTADLEIVDEHHLAVPAGVEGLVRMKLQPVDPTGYIGDPALSADRYREGWFYPGDTAIARADGRIRIMGRTADVLNVGGNKVAVGPYEAQAMQILGLEAVCLYSHQQEDGETALWVVIEGDSLPPRERLEAYHAAMRGAFPRIEFKAIGPFALTRAGFIKIDRRAVLERARTV